MNLHSYLRQEDFRSRVHKKAEREVKARLSPEQYKRFESLRRRRDNSFWGNLTKQDVLEFYQFIALHGIHEIGSSLPVNYEGAIDTFETIPNLCKDGKRILDAACGSGLFSCWLGLKYRQKEIFGIDFSRDMAQRAKKRKDKYNLSNVQFHAGDITNTGFLDGCFDIITCIDAIFEGDPDYTLNEFSRVLAQKGKVIVKHKQTFPPNSSIDTRESVLKDYKELFNNSGFSIVDCYVKPVALISRYGIGQEIGYVTWQAIKVREPKPISISYRTNLIGRMRYGYAWPLIKTFKRLFRSPSDQNPIIKNQ